MDRKGQIRGSFLYLIVFVFALLIFFALFFRLKAPEKVSGEIFISELMLIIIFPFLMFGFHIFIISREIRNSEEHLSRNHESIENSIEEVMSVIDSMIFAELMELRREAEREQYEKKKIVKMLQDCLTQKKPSD